jgi:tetratricopeptide (TPR) repeat protein
VLGRQLNLAPTPEARASVLTDLGRAAWEGSNDATLAQKYLDEALTLVPDHLPAVITIADIYFKENQWENAEKRLAEAVRKLRGQPQQMVRLYQRLAEVHEKLGKLDEAYRQLLEADRMGPGQLLTKLSLGENRFRAAKWREAALHLGGLADHPDAALYPDDVADALAHGAQSEIKLRRPERALALYEAALRLRANHRASLRALADLAFERGEKHQSATYLRRLADDASDTGERASLYQELGDRLTDVGADAQALAAYNEALKLAGSPGEGEVALMEKALKLQRATGDKEGAAHTSTLLISLVKHPDERAQRRRDAALMMMESGDEAGAADLVLAGLEENPQDEKALATLCEVWGHLGKDGPLAKRLAKVLPTLPPPAEDAAARSLRADLWQRLGELRVKRAPDDALADFQRVIELDPQRLSARESLAALYGSASEYAEAAALNHRMLLATNIARPDSLRALAANYAGRGLIDRARCCTEILDLLGFAEADDRAFLRDHPAPDLKPDDPYAAVVDDSDRHAFLAIDEVTLMAEIFSSLWEGAPGLIGQRIEDFGVAGPDKISPMSDLDLGKIYGQVAKALGNKKTALYASSDAAASDLTIVVQSPPALIAGPGLAQGASHAEIRFELGRGLELSRPEYILAAGVPPKQFAQLFSSVLKAFHPRHSKRRTTAGDAGADQATKLKKNVPYKVSKRLVELFSELGSTSWSSVRWRAVVRHTGNRAGLLLCGDLKTATRVMLRNGRDGGSSPTDPSPESLRELLGSNELLRDLLHYAISEEYFHLREKLGTAAASAAAA